MEIENEYRIVDLKSEDFMGVTSQDGVRVTVGTREISKRFSKEHKDIINMIERRIESIKSIGESETEKFLFNFIESSYKSRGKTFKEYQLTKDGFIFVVMGLEGLEAEKLKIEYITIFNKMYQLIETRQLSKIGFKGMSKAIKDYYDRHEKSINQFAYSNEADMINLIVLGMKSNKFKEVYGVDRDEATRDIMPEWKLKMIDKLERLNTDLIEMDMEFRDRKEFLQKRYLVEVERKIEELSN